MPADQQIHNGVFMRKLEKMTRQTLCFFAMGKSHERGYTNPNYWAVWLLKHDVNER